ncbi:MAG: hypothetical protein IJF72_01885 [Clostridia bacterium]|nr:hypothetical protein [Clostridia bacterium]
MKNSKSKVLMTSVIMLVVAVMALTTATYAWFISADSASVTDITMQAASASGIRFSADNGTTWKNYLVVGEASDNATPDIEIEIPSDGYNPTSTNAVLNSGAFSFFYAHSYEDGFVVVEEDPANFIHLAFKIRLDGDSATTQHLWLTSDSAITSNGSLDSILRVAFVYNNTVKVWQPNQEQANTYKPLVTEKESVQLPVSSIITDTDVIGDEIGSNHLVGGAANLPVFDFANPQGTSVEYDVEIYIWLEGQDPDCTNAVASQNITANLVFTFIDPTNNG